MLLSARNDFPGEARDFHGPTSEAARTADLGVRKGHTRKEWLKRTYSMFFRHVVPIAGLAREEQKPRSSGELSSGIYTATQASNPGGCSRQQKAFSQTSSESGYQIPTLAFFWANAADAN